jgi:23S rRNA (guanine745-N1)-methyltransferase
MILRCPVCAGPLSRQPQRYVCERGHSFDVAREGYVNLLLGHQKASPNPGDSREMVVQRQAFLEAGYYLPLARRLGDLIAAVSSAGTTDRVAHLLDAGCGEGYYLRQIEAALASGGTPAERAFWGLDISRDAIRRAARRDRLATYLIASVHRLPFPDSSLDLIWQVFAPPEYGEFGRVLRPGGGLIVVRPGPEHLAGLKRLLFAEPRAHPEELEPTPGFRLLSSDRLTYSIELRDPATIQALLGMTPYYWTAGPSGRARLTGVAQLATPVDFVIHRLEGVRSGLPYVRSGFVTSP